MLHIKDIEAFARINEALNEHADGDHADCPAVAAEEHMHPALVMALVATGRLPMSALPKAVHSLSPLLPWNGRAKRP